MSKNSDNENIMTIMKLLEKTLLDKLNEKDQIIKNLMQENLELKEQLNKKNKPKKKKKDIEEASEFIYNDIIQNDNNNVVYFDQKGTSKAKCKEMNDFFKKEYLKYQHKNNNNT